jgi:hypothetical protein
MTDPNGVGSTGDTADAAPDRRSTGGMPLWVKISLIVVGILIALFVVLNLTGRGGQHGPGRHVGPVQHGAPAGVGRGG